jgi:hypothetical protein
MLVTGPAGATGLRIAGIVVLLSTGSTCLGVPKEQPLTIKRLTMVKNIFFTVFYSDNIVIELQPV